jgi:hypothetical protein
MGNHGYNAICYHARKLTTYWLYPHAKDKFEHHEAFLRNPPLITLKPTADFPTYKLPAISEILCCCKDEKPVFFDHYWKSGKPKLQQANLLRVDYAAGKGENLVCYSFRNKNFCTTQ